MLRDGMRIENPVEDRGAKMEKKKDEWRRKEVPDFCYATRWHGGRGTWSWTGELRKKKKRKEKGQMKGA